MRFKKQGWLKNALATPRGFVHPRTREMLKRVQLSPREIMDFNGWGDEMIPEDCPAVVEEKPVKKSKKKEKVVCDHDVCEDPDCKCDCHKDKSPGIVSKIKDWIK